MTTLERDYLHEPLHLPMRRNFAQPLNAGVLHRRVVVEAPGDGAGDECGALLLQQLYEALLPGDHRVNPGRLPVQERGDRALFGEGWESNIQAG